MDSSLDTQLAGQRILVTGGGRGIGRGVAEALAAAGARVAIAGRTREQVERTASEIREASAHVFDVTNISGIPSFLTKVEESLGGAITCVVHAAGVQHRQPAEDFDLDAFRNILEVHLVAPFALTQAIARRQFELGIEGLHLFIGSLTSFISMPDISAYGAAKSGVYGLVRSLSSEWSGRGIRVNGIAPGYIRTELTEEVFADEEWRQSRLNRIPQRRFGEPSDIGNAAVFLASASSAYVTGQMFPIDGGWLSA